MARIGDNDEAMSNLAQAKELAQDRMERNYVESAEQAVSLLGSGQSNTSGQSRQFVLMSERGDSQITAEEAISLTSEKGFLTLDLRGRRPACTGPEGLTRPTLLEDGEAQLLEYLWIHPGYQSD